jgi:hypothetical protein
MFRRPLALAWLCSAILGALAPSAINASTITETAAIPLSQTNWGPTNLAGSNPLVFAQFDTQGGTRTLDSVNISLHTLVQNNFQMTFTAPSLITDSVATGNPAAPGPTITLYQSDGVTPLMVSTVPNNPADLTRSVVYGFNSGQTLPQVFSSALPATSPFYIAPASTNQTTNQTLTSPTSLAMFTGTGSVVLPVAASAYATITSNTGNGQGRITTTGEADVTVTYTYTTTAAAENLPEPASLIAWSLGGAAVVLLRQRAQRRRAA